jgi:phosphoribosylanthranilate isomerase
MSTLVKICGLTTVEAVAAANDADFAGFIFYPPSPRNVTPTKAAELTKALRIPAVAVTVDADDQVLEAIKVALKPAYFQLHGKETPARLQDIKAKFGIPIIKAIPIASGDDAAKAHAYEEAADMLLFDARPPRNLPGGLPGGNGITFDWRILANRSYAKPWFLSGGLDSDNIQEALQISGASKVDVSSSLESGPGIKDPVLVREFIKKVRDVSL